MFSPDSVNCVSSILFVVFPFLFFSCGFFLMGGFVGFLFVVEVDSSLLLFPFLILLFFQVLFGLSLFWMCFLLFIVGELIVLLFLSYLMFSFSGCGCGGFCRFLFFNLLSILFLCC